MKFLLTPFVYLLHLLTLPFDIMQRRARQKRNDENVRQTAILINHRK